MNKYLRELRIWLLIGFTALLNAPLFSQVTDSIIRSARIDSAVVIQTTRVLSGSPVPHTNLKAATIAARYHAQDIPMLLGSTPGVVETSDAGAGTGYTGMRVRGTDPTRINVTINGVPFNDAESQGVFWVNMPDLAASASEIQVQRGVGTSTHGAGAFGATVNVDLSRVAHEAGGSITQTVGSFGTTKTAAQWHTGILQSGWSLAGRLSRIRSDGFVDRADSRLQSAHLTATWLDDDRQSWQVHYLDGQERTYQAWYGLPAQYLGIDSLRTYNPSGTERADQPHPDEVDNYRQRHVLAHYKRLITNNLLLQVNGHYTRGRGYFEQYKADQSLQDYGLDHDTATDLIRRRWLDNHFGGMTFALRWDTRAMHQWTIGGGANQYNGTHFGELIWANNTPVPPDYRYYDNQAIKQDRNLYIQQQSQWGRVVTTFADLQVRQVRYTFEGFDNELKAVEQTADLLFFNPKVGVTVHLTPRTHAYAYAGVAHREPNRDDYTQSTPQSRPRAERLLDVEMGFRSAPTSWASGSVNLFGMWYRDQLALDGRINDVGAYIRTNVPQSSRIGLELEGSLSPHKSLIINGNISLGRHQIQSWTAYLDDWDTGAQIPVEHRRTPLAFAPAMTAFGSVGYEPPISTSRHKMGITLSTKYVAQQYLDNTGNAATRLPAYAWADLSVRYVLKINDLERITLLATAHNFTNAQFVTNGWTYRFRSAGYDPRPDNPYVRSEGDDVYHQAGFFPQAGRYWMLTARVGF
jgi:iron complex outermembrane recepter protein